MKTSNKILLCLLIVIFAIPFLLAFSLKIKVKKGEYTTVKSKDPERVEPLQTGTFTSFKVVKVIAPGPDLLTCHLKLSENMNYTYYQRPGGDSLTIFTGIDTLYITYVPRKVGRYNAVEVNINLPSFKNLVVDGAVVILDSLPASPDNIIITLLNNGEIKDGSEKKKEQGEVIKEPSALHIPKDKITEEEETYKVSMKDRINMAKLATIQNASFEIFSVSVKDIIMFHIL